MSWTVASGHLHPHVRDHAATAALQQYSLKCKKCVSQKKNKVIKNTINQKTNPSKFFSYPRAIAADRWASRTLLRVEAASTRRVLAFRTRKKKKIQTRQLLKEQERKRQLVGRTKWSTRLVKCSWRTEVFISFHCFKNRGGRGEVCVWGRGGGRQWLSSLNNSQRLDWRLSVSMWVTSSFFFFFCSFAFPI